jgi:hypothetical protein
MLRDVEDRCEEDDHRRADAPEAEHHSDGFDQPGSLNQSDPSIPASRDDVHRAIEG